MICLCPCSFPCLCASFCLCLCPCLWAFGQRLLRSLAFLTLAHAIYHFLGLIFWRNKARCNGLIHHSSHTLNSQTRLVDVLLQKALLSAWPLKLQCRNRWHRWETAQETDSPLVAQLLHTFCDLQFVFLLPNVWFQFEHPKSRDKSPENSRCIGHTRCHAQLIQCDPLRQILPNLEKLLPNHHWGLMENFARTFQQIPLSGCGFSIVLGVSPKVGTPIHTGAAHVQGENVSLLPSQKYLRQLVWKFHLAEPNRLTSVFQKRAEKLYILVVNGLRAALWCPSAVFPFSRFCAVSLWSCLKRPKIQLAPNSDQVQHQSELQSWKIQAVELLQSLDVLVDCDYAVEHCQQHLLVDATAVVVDGQIGGWLLPPPSTSTPVAPLRMSLTKQKPVSGCQSKHGCTFLYSSEFARKTLAMRHAAAFRVATGVWPITSTWPFKGMLAQKSDPEVHNVSSHTVWAQRNLEG